MLAYIKSILPRLQKYSKHLDKTENFVGKEWLLIDDSGNNHSYEFLRDGRLIMTLVTNSGSSQETQVGSWELLPTERLLITRPQGKLILRQGFIGDGLLILQESGTTNIPFNCFDPKVIPDGNVEAYLKKYIEVKESAQLGISNEVDDQGRKVYRNPDGSLYDGELRHKDDEAIMLVIEKGIETGRYCVMLYDTDKGAIKIKILLPNYYVSKMPRKEDEVFLTDGISVADGEYKLKSNDHGIESITVLNGKIIDVIDVNWYRILSIMLAIITILVLLWLIYSLS